MPFANLFLTTTLIVFGVHPCHPPAAPHGHPPFGSWHHRGLPAEAYAQGWLGAEMLGQSMMDSLGWGVTPAPTRHPAPVVVLDEQTRLRVDPTGDLFSRDRPVFWTAVPYGPLTVEVRLPVIPEPTSMVLLGVGAAGLVASRKFFRELDGLTWLPSHQDGGESIRFYSKTLSISGIASQKSNGMGQM
jgi:hypothetical protein